MWLSLSLVFFETVKLPGISEVFFEPADTRLSATLTTGTWVVGLDIPAGTYNAVSRHRSESGNFIIHNDAGWPVVNEILMGADSDFGFGVESVRVNLQDGWVITVSGMTAVSFEAVGN